MTTPKHTNAVILRLEPCQAEYDALAHRYGQKKATRADYRSWAEATLRATMEQIVNEMYKAQERATATANFKAQCLPVPTN